MLYKWQCAKTRQTSDTPERPTIFLHHSRDPITAPNSYNELSDFRVLYQHFLILIVCWNRGAKVCWQSLRSLQQKATDQIFLGHPRKKDSKPLCRGGKSRIYVSSPIQGSSGDLKQILAICIYHRPVQLWKQFWFMTTRFLSETTKAGALP